MISTGSEQPRVFIRRIGRHHFAHLRAVAQGVPIAGSARRYLAIELGQHAATAHRQVVDALRAIARRHGDKSWRLIGLLITLPETTSQPSLDEFAASRDLDGWSEAELAQMYEAAFPASLKVTRRRKLHEKQLALLRLLESIAAEKAQTTDCVSGWFDDLLSRKLITAGLNTLGELQAHIDRGGHWYRHLAGVGENKAQRIVHYLAALFPETAHQHQAPRPRFVLEASSALPFPPKSAPIAIDLTNNPPTQLFTPPSAQPPSPRTGTLISAPNDLAAVAAWVDARAGSLATAKAYRREAHRLLLWLQYERASLAIRQMDIQDCRDFMAFLQHIPSAWISRRHAQPGQVGWAPFRGPLSKTSYRQSIVIIASMFSWLQSAQYLSANPWLLINQKTGDDPSRKMLDTKALSEVAFSQVLAYVAAQPPSPSRHRIRFILLFVESVGMRASELLSAQLGDLQLELEGWVMQVHGKGAKNRIVAIPGQAFDALQMYLFSRGLGGVEAAPPHAPLVASAIDAMLPVGYQALYEHVKRWILKAVAASDLSNQERTKLHGATLHWLRHTFGTRAIAREVPLDVIQAQMGHASIQTTTAIYGRAPIRRRVDELGKAFS